MSRYSRQIVLGALWLGLALVATACGPAPVSEPIVPAADSPDIQNDAATTTPEATSALAALAPTATPTENAAVQAAPTQPAPADWSEVATVEGDYVILGDPAAPIRLLDYSDFM